MTFVVVGFGAAALGVLVAWFVELERSGRREVIFGVVLAALLLELVTQPAQHNVPSGLFRIPFPMSGGLRPPDVLIPIALVARAVTSDVPRRVSTTGLLWGAFLAWYTLAAVLGVLYGNPIDQVLFHGRAILYVGGGMVVASGVNIERITSAPAVTPWALSLGLVGVMFFALTPIGGAHFTLPGVGAVELGLLGADESVILPISGAIVLLLEAARRHRHPGVLIAGVVLIAAPFTSVGAAGLLVTGALFLAGTVAAVTPTWRRRARATPTEALLFLGAVAFFAVPAVAAMGQDAPLNPSENIERALFSESQGDTTYYRVVLYGQAVDVVEEHPVFGAGLGIRHRHPQPWPLEPFPATAHNTLLDVAARSGLVGLTLLFLAGLSTARRGIGAWRRHPNGRVATFALACLLGLAGLTANAMVSSSLEKFRQGVLLGLLVGLVVSAYRSLDEPRTARAFRVRQSRPHPAAR